MSAKKVYKEVFNSFINKIHSENRYRLFVEHERTAGRFPIILNKRTKEEVISWCSNDYLCMSENPVVINAAMESISKHGVGSGGTRNISGNHSSIVRLEKFIAKFHKKEAALVFSSGYIANTSSVSAIIDMLDNPVVISDECNHSSIINGIKNAKNTYNLRIFKNNNVKEIEDILKSYPNEQHKIIICESVYSMNGFISPLEDICYLSNKYNALLYVDEVHSVGLYNKDGSGIVSEKGLTDDVDIVQGNLAKGLGVFGGYVASSKVIVDSIRSYAPGFIFTTSIPPSIADGAVASIKYIMASSLERQCIHDIVCDLKGKLRKKNINYIENDSHIVILPIGDPIVCKKIHDILLNKYNIYIQYINYPTVKKGSELLRITPSSKHTVKMVDYLVNSLLEVFKSLSIVNKQEIKIKTSVLS